MRCDSNRPDRDRLTMPTYEYRCDNCKTHIEVKERYEFGPECFHCGRNMRREWTAPAVQFKGSGFYKTDNR